MNVSATRRPVCSAERRAAPAPRSSRTTPLPASTTGRRAADEVGGPQQAHGVGLASAAGAARQRRGVDLGRHHVLGQLEVRRAGLLGCGDLERLAHRLGDDARVSHARVPLGDRPHDRRRCRCTGATPCACRSRSAWPVSATSGARSRKASATPVTRLRGARAEGAEAHAGAAGEAAEDVGHERGALLVADGHEGDRRAVERLAQVQRLLAGDAEDVLDALGLEALDEHVGGGTRSLAGGRGREDGVGTVGHAALESSIPVPFHDAPA